MKQLSLVGFILVVFSAAPAPPASYSARVIGVSDGDTLTVLAAGNRQVKIRLHGIDCPETGQDFGARAKQAASELAFGQVVTILPRDTDRYGRTVAEVRLPDGRSLNRVMVGRGMAWHYRQYAPNDAALAKAEADARRAEVGLWSQANPVPPWEWRKQARDARAPKATSAVGPVVGNVRSHAYHAPGCPSVAKMKPENRVAMGSAAEAERKGFRKAGDCR